MSSCEIFLLAGETSGDARGAELIRELRKKDPSLSFIGMGGSLMKAEGMEMLADLSPLAVVGIFEVLKHYGTFKRTMDHLLQEIDRRKPAAVIGVDYPGFNLRLLEKARRSQGRSLKLIQYISPQLWAWNERRKWGMAQYLDLVLCIFPFEPALYKETNLKAVFVGHPLAEIPWYPEEGRDAKLIALFPGSREKEIQVHMPVFAELEAKLQNANKTHFAYACTNPQMAAVIHSYSPRAQIESPSHLYAHAAAGMVCSGTATLEAALSGLPIGVVYRVAWPTYWMGRAFIRVPFLAMPNLLAQRELIKEFIQSKFTAENISEELKHLRDDSYRRQEILEGYQDIRVKLGKEKAAEKAAEAVLKLIFK